MRMGHDRAGAARRWGKSRTASCARFKDRIPRINSRLCGRCNKQLRVRARHPMPRASSVGVQPTLHCAQARPHLKVAKAGRRGILWPMPARTDDPENAPTASEPPHYLGHRQRLRERFLAVGADALSDYELLEMVLFTAQPRRDMKPLAKALLKRFGSFAEAIHAPEPLLREVEGIGEATITQLRLIAAA